MSIRSIVAVKFIIAGCVFLSCPAFAAFDKEEWKNSGGLCAVVSVKDGVEAEYFSKTERENTEDAEYNFTKIQSFEECSFSAAQLILVFESIRPMLPGLLSMEPFPDGYLIYNDKGDLKTCTVTRRKPNLDRISLKLRWQIVRKVGQPIPQELRDELNSEEMRNLIRQNISISCSGAFW